MSRTESVALVFQIRKAGWEELGDMLKIAHPTARRAETDPLVQPTLLFLPRDTGRQVFPDLPQMAPTSSREHCAGSSHGNRMEEARTQASVLHLLYLPFIKQGASPLAAFSSLPNSEWEPLFQETSGAQSQGRRMFACCPPPNLVRPSPPRPTPLAADRVPSDHLCELCCGMGGELMRPSQCKYLFTLVGMQRDKRATNLSVGAHIQKPASGHRGFSARICSISPPPLLQRRGLTFKRRACSPGQILRRKLSEGRCHRPWVPLWGFSGGGGGGNYQNKKQSE